MSDTKICTTCGKSNNHTAAACVYCGTAFTVLAVSETTSHVLAPPVNKQFTPERVIQLTGLYSELLVFQIASYEQPLLVKVSNEPVVIGRYSPGEKPPTVDLTPFNGSLMGVSRKHAVITKDDQGYEVRDLASTNGTWVNETKLNPNQAYRINSGDMLRLGQVNTNVYFRISQSKNPEEVTLTLRSEIHSTTGLGMTPTTIDQVLTPYLRALEGFQRSCDEIMNHPLSEMIVTLIQKDPEKPQFVIKIIGLYQAFRLLRINILRWRETHRESIINLNQQSFATTNYPLWSLEPPTNDVGEKTKDQTLCKAGIELAHEILSDLVPHRTQEDNHVDLPKFLPFLQQIALSPLSIVQDTDLSK